jgi:hypothetical protein
MEDVAEASEEILWTAGFAVVAAVLLFALLAATTWQPPCWAPGSAPSERVRPRATLAGAQPEEASPTGQLTPVPPMPQ